MRISGDDDLPLGKGCRAALLGGLVIDEVAFLIKVVVKDVAI